MTSNDPNTPRIKIEPIDGALPPWIWLTLSTLSLFCLLFISFRRAKSLELYERAKEYLQNRVERYNPFSSHRSVHLPTSSSNPHSTSTSRLRSQTLSSQSDDDDDDEEGNATSNRRNHSLTENDDELPDLDLLSSNRRTETIRSLEQRSRSMISSLGENVVVGVRKVGEGLGWIGEEGMSRISSTGSGGSGSFFKEMIVGRRDVDRIGRIRLGDEGETSTMFDMEEGRSSSSNGRDAKRDSKRKRDEEQSRLFEVGDAEEDAAEELPTTNQFSYR